MSFILTVASSYNISTSLSCIILHRVEFSTSLGSQSLRTTGAVLCLSSTAGAASARAAHIFNTPEVVPTWQQHPVAMELQILCSAFLTQAKEYTKKE